MTPWTNFPKPILALAPMAGISTAPFRQICHRWGADVTFTPLLSAEAIVRGHPRSLEMMHLEPEEGPVVIQLFGKIPENVGKAAKLAQAAGAAGIDLNLGCPARKIVKQGIGVALAEDLDLCHEVLKQICDNVTVPVSLKIRAWARCHTREGFVTGPEIVAKMADLPVACITVHGRGTDNPFGGEVSLELIEAIKKQHTGMVLANGSIVDGLSAKKALDATGADGVAIARGSWGRPWVFKQIKAYLANEPFTEPTTDDKRQTILEHAKLAMAREGARGILEARKHFLWYTRGWRDGSKLRLALSQVKTVADVAAALATLPSQIAETIVSPLAH